MEGGLDICNTWLTENKSKLGRLLLKLLLILPVDFSDLKSNGKIGKTVKKIANHSDTKIQNLAKKLLNNWMQTVERAAPKKRASVSPITQGTPPKKVAKIKKSATISTSNAFGLNESAKPIKQSSKIVVKKAITVPKTKKERKVELINGIAEASSLPTTSSNLITGKRLSEGPLSADDIKKKKLNQRKETKSVSGVNKAVATSVDNKNQIVNDIVNNPPQSIVEKPSKPKKKVTWPPDNLLCKVKRFARDKSLGWNKTPTNNNGSNNNNTTVGNNSHAANNMNAQPTPSINKPKAPSNPPVVGYSQTQRNGNNPSPRLIVPFKNSIQWYMPHRLDIPPSIKIGNGINSKERFIQQQRDQFIPAANFHSGSIPESPLECDDVFEGEIDDATIPIIPLEDQSKYDDQQQNNLTQPMNSSGIQTSYSASAPVQSSLGNLDPALLQSLLNKPSIQQVLSILTNKSLNGTFQQSPVQNPVLPNYNVSYSQTPYAMNQVGGNNGAIPYQQSYQNPNYQ